MTDVGKVEGPSGPSGNQGRKDQKAIDAEKFKETRRRVDEIHQIDPDEQKKRKQREEEEDEPAPMDGPAAPPAHAAPFSSEEHPGKATSINTKRSVAPSNNETPPYKPTAHYSSRSFSETEEKSGVGNQESAAIPPPEPQPPPLHEEYNEPPLPPSSSEKTNQRPSPSRATHHTESTREKGKKTQKEGMAGISPHTQKEESSGFFEQMSKEHPTSPPPKKEEGHEEEAALEGALPPPSTPLPEEKKDESKKMEEMTLETSIAGLETQLPPLDTVPQLEPMPAYTRLPPEVAELFDRMVGVMTVMQMSGISETTFTLNSPQFASSVFFGSQIIIQEYSTAPKAFNIQLNGTSQAVALFQSNADELMAAFQNGGFGYKVNRLQTGYLEEKPLFKRKEKTSGDNQDTGPGP